MVAKRPLLKAESCVVEPAENKIATAIRTRRFVIAETDQAQCLSARLLQFSRTSSKRVGAVNTIALITVVERNISDDRFHDSKR